MRSELSRTKGFKGITGTMSIDAQTGNRVDVPVVILTLGSDGAYVVNSKWATFAGFGT